MLQVAHTQRLGYSATEFAEAFGCTKTHVHNLIRRGELASITLGRRRIIPATVVEQLLASATRGGDPDGRAA